MKDRYNIFKDSPVEELRKTLPRGDGNWLGYSKVYTKLSKAADRMGQTQYRMNDFHVKTMAVLGCGHEETMKYHQMLLREYGWLEEADSK